LLIANVVVFLLQLATRDAFSTPFALWPLGGDGYGSPGFMPWQLLTYGFMHGGFQHLFFNMLALYMFGGPLEQTWGSRRFTIYYLICIAGAGLCQLAVGWWMVQAGNAAYPRWARRAACSACCWPTACCSPTSRSCCCSRRSR
jgi:membrane associated rhomboid family serine protease